MINKNAHIIIYVRLLVGETMADKNIRIGIEVNSNGTADKEIKKADALRAAYDKAAASAQGVGGTAGSRAVAARHASMSGQEYGQARGSAGVTGAGARDFANQAQGLGGLVRLYATYAANLFAVTAAFQALSNAMETTNMVRGLDQLGSASGTALGSLSKDFVKATDGAISFREAMEATAKATSSGMSSKQLLDIGDVAKKASQALGVNMGDAVSRLTRGITKLEPELLDELGIFTKVGKATEDYARKVGKAESSLTDFERRQAFANAVIEEGKKKFAEIDIPSNPYAKFLSALKDAGQAILEVINKGIVPLINFLSANPTALLVAIGGVASMILKQALPAIGQYRAELRKSADEELKLAEAKSKAATKALAISRDAKAKEIQAEKDKIAELRTAQVDEAQMRLEAVSKKGLSKGVQAILKKPDIQAITNDDLAMLDKLGSKQTKVSAAYKELAASIRLAQQANLDFANSEKSLEARKMSAPGIFSTAGVAAWRAEQARRSASSKNILSNVGDVASEAGTVAAFKSLGSQLSTEKLGAVRTAFTGIAGAISIMGTAVGNVLTVVSRFMGWIGLAIGAYQLLSSTFSKNGAEIAAYEDSLTSLEDATKNATNTAKKYDDILSVNSILAKNNALGTIADTMSKVADSFVSAKNKASWFDNFTNSIAGWFGKSMEDKLVDQMSNSIKASIDSISDPKLKKQAEDQFLALTGAKSIEQIRSKLESMNSKEIEDFSKKLPKALQDVKTQADKIAQPLKSFKDVMQSVDKAYMDLSNSMLEKSPATEFASKLSDAARVIKTALQEPTSAVATFNAILEDTTQIKMFPPEAQQSILEAAQNMQKLETQAANAKTQIDLANKKLAAATDMESSGVPKEVVLRFKLEAQGLLKSATDTYVAATTKMQELTSNVDRALTKTVADSIKQIEAPFTRALAQANIDTAKTLLGLLPKSSESVKLQTQLELESIGLRKQELSQTRLLIQAINLERISREKRAIEDKLKNENIDGNDRKMYSQQLKDLQQEELAYKDPKALKGADMISAGAQNALRQNAGFMAQMAGLASQEQSAKIRGAVESAGVDFDAENKQRQDALKYYESELAAKQKSADFTKLTTEEQGALVSKYYDAINALKASTDVAAEQKAVLVATAAIDAAKRFGAERAIPVAEKALNTAKQELSTAEQIYETNKQAGDDARAKALAESLVAREVQKQNTEYEHQAEIRKILEDTTSKLEDVRKQELQYLAESGQISQDKYREETLALDKSKLLREKNNQLLQLEATYLMDVTKLLQDYAKAGTEDERQNAADKIKNRSTQYESQVNGINKVYDANNKVLDQTKGLSDRQNAYADAVKNSFNGLADAMVTWAETGKWAGKDLFNSLIADLARYELRMQTSEMYKAARPGLIGAVSSLFGGGMPGIDSSIATFISSGASLESAKGTAWDYGIQAFAQGGAFTNSIVDSPTMFKFAKGTGLMGEAGPEAIMPLKRDANGNLGVRAGTGGGNTEVVVNNYGSEQATAKETTDSRGNRRIEVTIGDMTAGEIARSGSASQKAVSGTFGLRPQLIRR